MISSINGLDSVSAWVIKNDGGKEVRAAIVDGTVEVLLPVVSATSTTVAAFLPMLIMTGTTGEFFSYIPKTITYAILASLLECLFILPIHYLDYGPRLRKGEQTHEPEAEDNLVMRLARRVVNALLRLTLRFRWPTLGVLFLTFVAAIGILGVSIAGTYPLIRIQFFPDDYNLYYVDLEGPGHLSREAVDERLRAITASIMADGPGMVDSAVGLAGFQISQDYQDVYANNIGAVIVTLPVRDARRFRDHPANDPGKHLDWIRERLKAEFETDGFTLRIRPQNDGPPTGKDINVRLLSSDAAQVAALAGSVLDGRYLGKYRASDEEIDLKLRIAPEFLPDPAAALRVPLIEHASGPVYLGDVCELETYTETAYINRYQNERALSLSADLEPGAPTSVPAIVHKVEEFTAIDYPLFGDVRSHRRGVRHLRQPNPVHRQQLHRRGGPHRCGGQQLPGAHRFHQ